MSELTLSGVRIDPDGTVADVAAPSGVGLLPWLREQLGGWPELAHYGTRDHAVEVVVHETSLIDGMPVNCAATVLVEEVRGGLLDYHLHGTVFVFGYEYPGEPADLRADTRALLATIAAGVAR